MLGACVALLLQRWPQLDPASARPASNAAHRVERELETHRAAATFIRRRLDPHTTTGLALTLALIMIVLGGILVGVLGLVVRAHSGLDTIDRSVSPWGTEQATAFARDAVELVTELGGTLVLTVVLVVVAIVETVRRPSRWLPVFLLAVAIGQSVITTTIKEVVDRVRPAIDSGAAGLGPSFPSGHAAGAAACFAAAALVLGRGRARSTHALLAGLAVFVAVAVAASRVLLGVHWLSDVIGGLALGWAWFALCSIAFGGRMLRFGEPVEAAERVIDAHHTVSSPP